MGSCWELDKNLPRKSIVLLFHLHFNNYNEIEILQHAHFTFKQASQCMNQFSNPCLAYSRCFGLQIFFLSCFVRFVAVGVITFILNKRKSKTFTQLIFKLHFLNFKGKSCASKLSGSCYSRQYDGIFRRIERKKSLQIMIFNPITHLRDARISRVFTFYVTCLEYP